MASSDCLFTLPLANLRDHQTLRAPALARSQRCSSVNTVVPAIDEWAAASACTEPGRLAGVEPGAAALASADPSLGANGGRGVGHGPLTCVFRPHTGQSRGCWPSHRLLACQSTRPPQDKFTGPRSRQRVLLLGNWNWTGQQEKTASARTRTADLPGTGTRTSSLLAPVRDPRR